MWKTHTGTILPTHTTNPVYQTMRLPTSSILITLANILIVLGILRWSSTSSERTLYDRYIITLEGTLLSVRNRELAENFYKEILDFSPLKNKSEENQFSTFVLSNKAKIFLKEVDSKLRNPPRASIVIRVRNGFYKLHKNLRRRIEEKPHLAEAELDKNSLAAPKISAIIERDWGKEFVVSDLDKNRIIFFSPRRRSSTRS